MKNVESRKTRRRKYEKADRTGGLGIDEGSGEGGISLRQVEQGPDEKKGLSCASLEKVRYTHVSESIAHLHCTL